MTATRSFKLSDIPAELRAKLKPTKKAATAAAKRLRKEQAEARRSAFCVMLARHHLPMPTPEYRFHESRMWRVDYAWPTYKVALEVEGGIWTQGRHTRGKGALGDMEKYNALTLAGWRLIRTVPDRLTGLSVEVALRKLLKARPSTMPDYDY
jgi:very-short-patch-repair endonuclease